MGYQEDLHRVDDFREEVQPKGRFKLLGVQQF